MTTAAGLRSERLAAHRIGARRSDGPARPTGAPTAVVRHMTALQGQDLRQTLWAVGVRATGTTRADVAAAFDRAEIVRSWPMRGTLHTLAPDDLRLLLSLTAERTIRTVSKRLRDLGVDESAVDRARDTTVAALDDGPLDRDALFTRYRAAGLDPSDGRGANLLLRLAQDGLIAWGPTARTGQSVVLLDAWAPPTGPVPERDEALARALSGYLRGHGPATLADFAGWTGLPLRDARRAREVAGAALVDVDADRLTTPERAETGGIATAHLLPGFDEYLLGYTDRSSALDHGLERVASSNGVFWPIAIVRGRVVGRWSRPPSADRVTISPFEPVSAPDRRALEAAAGRYARFVGRPLEVVVADAGT